MVNQPAVGQHIQCWISGLYLHCPQGTVPVVIYGFQRLSSPGRSAILLNEMLRFIGVLRSTEYEYDLTHLPLTQFNLGLYCGTGIKASAGSA